MKKKIKFSLPLLTPSNLKEIHTQWCLLSNGRKPMTAKLQTGLLIPWSKAIINLKEIKCNPCIEFFTGIMVLFYFSGTSHFFGQNLLFLKTCLLDYNLVVCLLSIWLFSLLVPPLFTRRISFVLHPKCVSFICPPLPLLPSRNPRELQ